jgi:hypothetical protein
MNKNEIVVTITAVGAVVANCYDGSLTINLLQVNYKNYIIVHIL